MYTHSHTHTLQQMLINKHTDVNRCRRTPRSARTEYQRKKLKKHIICRPRNKTQVQTWQGSMCGWTHKQVCSATECTNTRLCHLWTDEREACAECLVTLDDDKADGEGPHKITTLSFSQANDFFLLYVPARSVRRKRLVVYVVKR